MPGSPGGTRGSRPPLLHGSALHLWCKHVFILFKRPARIKEKQSPHEEEPHDVM